MNTPCAFEYDVHFQRHGQGAPKRLCAGPKPEAPATPVGGVARIARLMALAMRFEELVRTGAVTNQAKLARLGHVTRARISQITRLLHLAPDIQEQLLFHHRPPKGRDPLHLARLQPIAAEIIWKNQRRLWRQLTASLQAWAALASQNSL